MAEKDPSKLRDRAQLDVDVIGVYEAGIERIDVLMVREKLSEFRVDHQRHVQDLNAAIIRLGGTELVSSRDLKGTVLRGFTAVTSMMGDHVALPAMMANEELHNRSYASPLKADWTADIRRLIEKEFGD